MGKTATNISIILGLITVAFAGYYMYTQQADSSVSFDSSEKTIENMLNSTSVFIERRQELDKVKLNIAFFEDERFLSLRNFTTPITEQSIGRDNPFSETQGQGNIVNIN